MAKAKTTIEKPVWLKYTEKEVKDIILSIAKKQPEFTSEKIGLVLRDTYGIPKTKIYGMKIGQVLQEAGLYKNPDLLNLESKTEKLKKHLENNKQDKKTGRAFTITRAKLKKTKEYIAKKEAKRNK
jgi:ribosomal protein S15P/S13E